MQNQFAKKLLVLSLSLFITSVSFCQAITDTAAFIAKGGYDPYLIVDGKAMSVNFIPEFVSRFPNQALIMRENNEPKMLIALPSNIGSSKPTPGDYNIMSGKKLGVKKGSQEAKLDIKPNYISTDNGGVLHVLYYNELFWFVGEDITIIDTKTNEIHKVSFKIVRFI